MVNIDDSQVGVVSDDKVGVSVEWYRYKSSLAEDMARASLIISHGGESLTTWCMNLCCRFFRTFL